MSKYEIVCASNGPNLDAVLTALKKAGGTVTALTIVEPLMATKAQLARLADRPAAVRGKKRDKRGQARKGKGLIENAVQRVVAERGALPIAEIAQIAGLDRAVVGRAMTRLRKKGELPRAQVG